MRDDVTATSVMLGVMGGSIQLNQALFLRQVWDYPALKAGLAITPAPLFASLASPIFPEKTMFSGGIDHIAPSARP